MSPTPGGDALYPGIGPRCTSASATAGPGARGTTYAAGGSLKRSETRVQGRFARDIKAGHRPDALDLARALAPVAQGRVRRA